MDNKCNVGKYFSSMTYGVTNVMIALGITVGISVGVVGSLRVFLPIPGMDYGGWDTFFILGGLWGIISFACMVWIYYHEWCERQERPYYRGGSWAHSPEARQSCGEHGCSGHKGTTPQD